MLLNTSRYNWNIACQLNTEDLFMDNKETVWVRRHGQHKAEPAPIYKSFPCVPAIKRDDNSLPMHYLSIKLFYLLWSCIFLCLPFLFSAFSHVFHFWWSSNICLYLSLIFINLISTKESLVSQAWNSVWFILWLC